MSISFENSPYAGMHYPRPAFLHSEDCPGSLVLLTRRPAGRYVWTVRDRKPPDRRLLAVGETECPYTAKPRSPQDGVDTGLRTNDGECPISARPPIPSRWLTAGLFLAGGPWLPSANAGEGFYAAVALKRSFAGVDYEKSVELDSPFSVMTAGDHAGDPVDALKAAVGYRWPVSSRLYLAGEVEGAFYLNGESAGFLEGTGEGGTDVWPGAWTLERRRAVALNARLGYVPDSLEFLGTERSLYLFAGARWTDAEIEAAHVNRRLDIAGSRSADRTLNPWLAGAGIEFGDAGSRFDLRLNYAAGDVDFGFGGGAADDPRLGYAFEVREWSVSLGYVVPFGD